MTRVVAQFVIETVITLILCGGLLLLVAGVVDSLVKANRTIERARRECLTPRADRDHVARCYQAGGWR